MLRIYAVLIDLVRDVGPLIDDIGRKDPDLARQARRAMNSSPLNMAEGSYSRGRNRNARYQDSMGSLRELLACLEVAATQGFIAEIDLELRRRFDHVLGTLVNVVRGPR